MLETIFWWIVRILTWVVGVLFAVGALALLYLAVDVWIPPRIDILGSVFMSVCYAVGSLVFAVASLFSFMVGAEVA